jgi:hypothetical protein
MNGQELEHEVISSMEFPLSLPTCINLLCPPGGFGPESGHKVSSSNVGIKPEFYVGRPPPQKKKKTPLMLITWRF